MYPQQPPPGYPPQGYPSQPQVPQWNAPEPVTTFSIRNFANQTIIWVQGGYHPEIMTQQYGAKPAARGTVSC